jgi:hypothetical protein
MPSVMTLDGFVIMAHLLMPNTNLIAQPSHFEAWTFLPVGRRIQPAARGRHAPPMMLGRNEVANQLFHQALATLCPAL